MARLISVVLSACLLARALTYTRRLKRNDPDVLTAFVLNAVTRLCVQKVRLYLSLSNLGANIRTFFRD